MVIRGLSIHKKFVWLAIGCGCFHILLVYGYYYLRKLWTINVLIDFVLGIFIPPEFIPSNLESLGLLFSKVSLFLFLIIFFMLFPLRLINSGLSYKYRAKIHKITFLMFILTASFHSYLNAMVFSNNIVALGIILIGLFIWVNIKFIQYFSRKKKIHKQIL